MIAADGTPNVLEFNCRFGDPETQPILMRLQSDFLDLCEAALDGTLQRFEVRWDARAALGVVMAAGGYPNAFRNRRSDQRARGCRRAAWESISWRHPRAGRRRSSRRAGVCCAR